MAKSDNPFDSLLDLSDTPSDDKPSEVKPKPSEDKPKATRRTKEEKLQDDIDAAVELLLGHGYSVVGSDGSGTGCSKGSGCCSDPEGADPVVFTGISGTIGAVSGQVIASVDINSAAIPVLRIQPNGWVGSAPLELPVTAISDIRKALSDLENQAKSAE